MGKTIAIGNDHSGVRLKEEICSFLKKQGYEVVNQGTNSEASIDYPDIAHSVVKAITDERADLGILICGSGQGVAISANRFKNIRAAISWNTDIAELARKHNNSNVLCLPARFLELDEAILIVKIFLNTKFEKGRHLTRIEKIEKIRFCMP